MDITDSSTVLNDLLRVGRVYLTAAKLVNFD